MNRLLGIALCLLVISGLASAGNANISSRLLDKGIEAFEAFTDRSPFAELVVSHKQAPFFSFVSLLHEQEWRTRFTEKNSHRFNGDDLMIRNSDGDFVKVGTKTDKFVPASRDWRGKLMVFGSNVVLEDGIVLLTSEDEVELVCEINNSKSTIKGKVAPSLTLYYLQLATGHVLGSFTIKGKAFEGEECTTGKTFFHRVLHIITSPLHDYFNIPS